jgi:hypothetical protein
MAALMTRCTGVSLLRFKRVINRSPGDLTPVFDIILEKAMTLCGVAFGMLDTWDSQRWEIVATRGLPPALAEYLTLDRDTRQTRPLFQQILETRRPAHRLDTRSGDAYRSGNASVQALADLGGARTFLVIPLLIVFKQTTEGVGGDHPSGVES